MKPFIIVSWHTPDSLYSSCALRLKESLERFDLEHEINCLPAIGDWNQNVCHKPQYILEMMNKHPEKNIVWIDADSEVIAYPEYFKTITGDVGCLLWKGIQIFMSTAFFSNNINVRDFVTKWIELTARNIYVFSPEQYTFSLTLKEFPEIKFERLPNSYAFVKNESPQDESPVIFANLISRYGGFALYPRNL